MAEDTLKRVELTDDEYTVKQKLVRNRYQVFDTDNELVLEAAQKLFKMKEDFRFKNADGEPAFRVQAEKRLDFSGDYTITDEETGDVVAVLNKNFTFFRHRWNIKTPEGEEVAVVRSRSLLLDVLRAFSDILSFLPHKYSIETVDGEEIGEIEGKFAIRDQYTIRIEDARGLPRESLIAAAITVDALEGN
ncbi:MAG: LURP-one-related/scramblase family protein [Candidatus Nanohaloarchaea archaeon]